MFCPECGKKNEKGAKFCESCGAKLVSNTSKVKKTTKKTVKKEPMSKEKKILISVVCAIVLVLFVGFQAISSKYKPASIAKEYFLAVMDHDLDDMYSYLDVENSGFTSRKIFERIMDKEDDDEDETDLVNYSIADVTKSTDGLSATVTIRYTEEGSSSTSTATIYLIKDKKKKMLFFDNWKVSNQSTSLVENVRITTVKDSSVTIEGVAVDKKYLDKSSTSKYDVYAIPKMFTGEYEMSVTLKNGLSLKDEVKVGRYASISLTNLKIDDAITKSIEKSLPKTIETLYQSFIDKKSFADVKSTYDYKGADLSDLEDAYTSYANSISGNGLTKFSVSDVEVENSQMDDDGHVSVTADVNYEYTIKYKSGGSEKTRTKKLEDTMYFTFDYVNGEYKLIDMSSLVSYFSRYY